MAAPALVEGNSLVHKMNAGAFGTFRRAIDKLGVDWKDFTLPKIVVVGSESAGKSSLIENITKCAVFPRSKGICTKVPVCFELRTSETVAVEVEHNGRKLPLKDRDEILAAIRGIFDSLGDNVSKEQITVRVTAPDAPTLTLIDLPGIRTYPPELAQRTRELSEHYLKQRDTLVICVVQATDRLTGNNAVALTTERLGAEAKTRAILALAKPDIVAPMEWEEKVVARLQGTSSELAGVTFAGCVAVASRPQQPDGAECLGLGQVDFLEMEWWQGRGLPSAVQEKVGVQNLIAAVDGVFAKYIDKEWKPRAVKWLQGRQAELTAKRLALGPDPSTLTAKQVRDDIKARFAAAADASPFNFERLPVQPVNCPGWGWNWSAASTKQGADVRDWAKRVLASPQLLAGVRGIVTKACEDGGELKTKRFVKLRDELVRIATDKFNEMKPSTVERVDSLVTARLEDLLCLEVQSAADLKALERGVLRIVSDFVHSAVWAASWVASTDLSLEECPEVRSQRATFSTEITNIEKATRTIQQI